MEGGNGGRKENRISKRGGRKQLGGKRKINQMEGKQEEERTWKGVKERKEENNKGRA